MSEQQDKTYELDGTRPIADGEMEVADTFEEDGTRPIAESPDFLLQNESQEEKNSTTASDRDLATADSKRPIDDDRVVDTFEEDGTRPIVSGEMEVADTYEEDGTRPIGESPDFLVQNGSQEENERATTSDKNSATTDSKRPVDEDDRVVDTYEEDGTRPIMENEYEVVDTLGVDGNRPITNESYISPKQ